MIRSFRHRGLKRLYEKDERRGLPAEHVEKLRRILARLGEARTPQDMALPGYGLHELKGDRKGEWAVDVSGNWRIVFCFEGTDAARVNYEDYH